MPAELCITDGSTYVNLINRNKGFHVKRWRPVVLGHKGGGVWQDSPLSSGRRLVARQYANVIDSFELAISGHEQDSLIVDVQNLGRLLEKAVDYWATDWQDEPVWIQAVARCETNTRYAIIYSWNIPELDEPYNSAFIAQLLGMDNVTLNIEHGIWQADEPGTGACVEISSSQDYCWPPHVEYTIANDTRITVPDHAQIRNLPDNAMTCEAWIRADSWGETNVASYIFRKPAGEGEWFLHINNLDGLRAFIPCQVTSADSRSGTDDFSPDGQWHHVAFTWDDATYNYPRLWIDGVEPSYSTTINRNGAVFADGDPLSVGNYPTGAGSTCFDGDIGWGRLSDSIRYTTTFTPPARCTLPAIDGNTMGQWIGNEASGTTIDNQEGLAAIDGTLTNGTFGCDCYYTYGHNQTCEEEIYVANKQNMANITHAWTWSAANGFSGNLIGAALPFDLIDIAGAAPAVNDYVVFGINTGLADSGPFCSLVFDIGTAISGMTLTTWEYSTGGPGWAALTVQDNTNAAGLMTGNTFDTTGVNSVHWVPPAAWATQAENGITGYWVRARVTAVPGPHVAPTQQNRDIYSVVWPFIEIQADEIGGGIPALAYTLVHNQSNRTVGAAPALWSNRIIAGLRSVSRGANFRAYLNLADEQNPTGVVVVVAGAAAFQNDVTAPSGRSVAVTNPGARSKIVQVDINSPLTDEYRGTFHVYMRAQQTTGSPGDIAIDMQYRDYSVGTQLPTVEFDTTNDWQLLDFGKVTFGPLKYGTRSLRTSIFDIFIAGDGVADAVLWDLIMMPVDEWAIDSLDTNNVSASIHGLRGSTESRRLEIDSVLNPRDTLVSLLTRDSDGAPLITYLSIASGDHIFQANARQRLWFLSSRYPSTASSEMRSEPCVAFTVWSYATQRYLSMRGNR